MYGFDSFAIEKNGKVLALERGGCYSVALAMYAEKVDVEEEITETYREQCSLLDKDPEEFEEYKSVYDWATNANGDVLFLSSPKDLVIYDRETGKQRESIRDLVVRRLPPIAAKY